MQMSVKKTFGKNSYSFIVEGKNLYELVMESQKLSFGDIEQCGICGSKDLYLNARLAQKKYKYVEVKCRHCKSQIDFGTTMENDDIYYFKKNSNKQLEWKEYKEDNSKINE